MSSKNRFNKKQLAGKTINEDEDVSTKKRDIHLQLEDNLNDIREKLGNSSDIIIRQIECGSSRTPAAAIYVNGLIDNVSFAEKLRTIIYG